MSVMAVCFLFLFTESGRKHTYVGYRKDSSKKNFANDKVKRLNDIVLNQLGGLLGL